MKRILFFIISLAILPSAFFSCSSDDEPEKETSGTFPVWSVAVPAEASVNMMAWVQIPSTMKITEYDILAAFVGEDCRAIAIPSSDRTFVLTIKGVADEHSPITLKYYNAARNRIYTDSGHLHFAADEPVGVEEPYMFNAD